MHTSATPQQNQTAKVTPAVTPAKTTVNPLQLMTADEEEPLQMKHNAILPPGYTRNPLQRKQSIPQENPLRRLSYSNNPLQPKKSAQNPLQLMRHTGTPLQRMAAPEPEEEPILQPKKENNTGLPDNLKEGVESLSGYSMDDVKVHYNSDKPAQLQALAYAQGTDIHVAPGQEQHLPHEAWHVVQQKQGRVQPTVQMKQGVAVNDDKGLESEADVMGNKAKNETFVTPAAINQKKQFTGKITQLKGVTLDNIAKHSETVKDEKFEENILYSKDILDAVKNIIPDQPIENEDVKGLLSPLIVNFKDDKKNGDLIKFRLGSYVTNKVDSKSELWFDKKVKHSKNDKKIGQTEIVKDAKSDDVYIAELRDFLKIIIKSDLTPVHPLEYTTEVGLFNVRLFNNGFLLLDNSKMEVTYLKGSKNFSPEQRADPNLPEITSQQYNNLNPEEKKVEYIKIGDDKYKYRADGIKGKNELEEMFKSDKVEGSTIKIVRGHSHYQAPYRDKNPFGSSATEIANKEKPDTKGVKYEWCHLQGHGDGGSETMDNLVIGTKAVNTEQIGLEKAIREYRQLFKALDSSLVIRIKVSVLLEKPIPNKEDMSTSEYNIAKAIKYEIRIAEDPYKGRDRKVYTHYMDGQRKTISIEEVNTVEEDVKKELKKHYEEFNKIYDSYTLAKRLGVESSNDNPETRENASSYVANQSANNYNSPQKKSSEQKQTASSPRTKLLDGTNATPVKDSHSSEILRHSKGEQESITNLFLTTKSKQKIISSDLKLSTKRRGDFEENNLDQSKQKLYSLKFSFLSPVQYLEGNWNDFSNMIKLLFGKNSITSGRIVNWVRTNGYEADWDELKERNYSTNFPDKILRIEEELKGKTKDSSPVSMENDNH